MMGFCHLTKQVYVGIFCNCLDRVQSTTKAVLKSTFKKGVDLTLQFS